MIRTDVTLSLRALAVASSLGRAEDPAISREVIALQKAVKQAIKSAEPSIACIFVSRSDAYAQYPDYAPATDNSGRLGTFDASKIVLAQPPRHFGNREKSAERQAVDALDLSLPDSVPESFGSGVVLDASGLILTNAHVVRDATKIYVRLPGNLGSCANVHALDPRSDLAVLKLIDKVSDLQPIAFGDGDKVEVGDFVVSLANPY